MPYLLSTEQDPPYLDGDLIAQCRRCEIAIDAPQWVKVALGLHSFTFESTTRLNRKLRTMEITSVNFTWRGKVNVHEICVYRVHPDNSNWTYFEQTASLELPCLLAFQGQIEGFCLRQYDKNTSEARQVDIILVKDILRSRAAHMTPSSGVSSCLVGQYLTGEGDDQSTEPLEHLARPSSTLVV